MYSEFGDERKEYVEEGGGGVPVSLMLWGDPRPIMKPLANHQLTLENCQIVNLFGTMSMYDV